MDFGSAGLAEFWTKIIRVDGKLAAHMLCVGVIVFAYITVAVFAVFDPIPRLHLFPKRYGQKNRRVTMMAGDVTPM